MTTMLVIKEVLLFPDFLQGIIFITHQGMQDNSFTQSTLKTPTNSLKRMVLMSPSSAILIKNLLILRTDVMLLAYVIQTRNGLQQLLMIYSNLKNNSDLCGHWLNIENSHLLTWIILSMDSWHSSITRQDGRQWLLKMKSSVLQRA